LKTSIDFTNVELAQPYINDAQFPPHRASRLRCYARRDRRIALRHQLTVLQRTQEGKRIMLNGVDRCLWVWLSRLLLGLPEPIRTATVVDGMGSTHRRSFRNEPYLETKNRDE
jgi:hypothetical protein